MMLPIGRWRQDNKGFTFIELVLVVIVISILVAVSIPAFRRPFTRLQVQDTTQTLVQLIRYLQAKSVAERKLCRLNFDFSADKFWATTESEAQEAGFVPLAGRWGKVFQAPEAISLEGEIEGEGDFIDFYPDGSTDRARIIVSDQKGTSLTVITPRHIGYVKIEE